MKHNFSLVHFDTLPSTNDYAKLHYPEYQQASVIWCDQQTRGRGRFERQWDSHRDLTFSIIYKKSYPHHVLAPLAIVQALQTYGYACQIKWPNDVLYQGKKLCGILIEKMYEGNHEACTIVGIGVNLTQVSQELSNKAIWVPLNPIELLQTILLQYELLLDHPIQELIAQYRIYHYLKGRKIKQNDVLWDVLDITPEGYLLVKHQDEVVAWKSEEVTLDHIY